MGRLVLTTMNDAQAARHLAEDLIQNRLAACVNILPQVTSIYRWKDQIEKDEEWLLLIKTTEKKLELLESYLTEHHPYEVPEIAVINLDHLNPDYHRWLIDSVQG